MRVLLDENMPARLRRMIPGHEVRTVSYMGWAGIQNGQLLSRAQHEFDVLVTFGSNMQYQNVIASYNIALLVLRLPVEALRDRESLAKLIAGALPRTEKGKVLEISSE